MRVSSKTYIDCVLCREIKNKNILHKTFPSSWKSLFLHWFKCWRWGYDVGQSLRMGAGVMWLILMDYHQLGGCCFLIIFFNDAPLKTLSDTGDGKPSGKLELLHARAVFSGQPQVLEWCTGWKTEICQKQMQHSKHLVKEMSWRGCLLHPHLGLSPGLFQTSLAPAPYLFCLCLVSLEIIIFLFLD